MKTAAATLALILALFVAWPYTTLYRLDRALAHNDEAALVELLDITAIRAQMKRNIERDMSNALGGDSHTVLGWVKEQLNDLGGEAIEEFVDVSWVAETLNAAARRHGASGFSDGVDYAFYESWNRFIIRLGTLGDDPTHLRLSLSSTGWRVTAVYQ